MTQEDRRAFGRLMLTLAEVYDKAMSDVVLEAYFEALRDYELEFLERAVRDWLRTSEWFPRPSQLREAASRVRGEARRTALPAGQQRALGEGALTAEEIKAFLAELRARVAAADPAPIPRKSLAALHEDAERLKALGACDPTADKWRALEQFRRYQDRHAEN
jgi:hypothetical protein